MGVGGQKPPPAAPHPARLLRMIIRGVPDGPPPAEPAANREPASVCLQSRGFTVNGAGPACRTAPVSKEGGANMARWSLALVCLVVGGVAGTFVAGPLLHGDNPAPQAVAIPKEITSYRDVVKKVLPAVVSIEARAKPKARVQQERNPRRRADLDDMQLPDEFRKFLEEYQDGQAE